ncbi:MAG: aspartyl protease family protein [Acidobacteria bacterium]|nr:aspartyl protease family protein [Acidobacteriota bacterium]
MLPCAVLAAVAALGFQADGQATPDDPAAQYQLATEMYDGARYREALAAYELAAQSDDPSLVARARRGRIRTALRIAEFDLAWREAQLLNDDPGADPEAQTLLGDALWAMGRFDESDVAYRRALDEAPGLSRARFGLARSLTTRSRLDEALNEALVTVKEAPEDPEVHALVGFIYERMNRYDESAAAFERYLDLLPGPRSKEEPSSMAAVFQSKVRLLRSFRGRVPLQMEGAPERLHRIPFRLVNKKIVLRGRVNRLPVEFVLDTGSERTGVSDGTARRAGVGTITSTLTAGVGIAALRRLDMGRADELEVGTLRMRNVPVAIRRVVRNALPRWQNESLSPLSLGLSVVVDYQRREVILARKLPDQDADFVLPMRMNRLPMVRGLLNSTHPAYFVVDTGGELISISAETADSLSMNPPRRIPLRVYGMSGLDQNAYLLPGVDVDFEEIEFRNVGLAVLNLRAPSVLLGFQVGGIVGHRFLSEYRVSMDMERSELRLERFEGSQAVAGSR